MVTVYKTKIFSGDGQTFIRPFILYVPCATATGSSRVTSSYAPWGSGGAAFYLFTEGVKNSETCKVLVDQYCTMWGTGSVAEHAAEAGGMSVVNLCKFIGGLSPAVGQAVRMVFNNNSYIKITINTYSTANSTITASFKFAYYDSSNTLLGTITSGERYDQPAGNTTYATLSYFPFAMPNEQGVYEDTHVRHAIGSSNDSMIAVNANRKVEDGIGQWPLVGPAAGISTAQYTPYQTNIDIATMLNGLIPVDIDDPYVDVPDSTPSGPAQGTGIPANDPVDIPSLPTASAIDTGFISLFNPTLAQVRDLADFMWTNTLFDINNLKKIFANPMDCILGFNMVPVDVPSGGAASVTVGNIVSTVSMNVATSQWVEKSCGSINVDQWIGNYMDFAPDSKYSIYLPYIGIRELSTDDVVGKTITLVYHVDVLSCSCIAFLKCGDSVLYEFAGQCGYSIPVTNNDFTQMIANICRLAVGIGGAVAGGGMSASGVGNMADAVMGLKPEVHRSGSVGGSTGLMGGQTPYLIMELPNLCKPAKQYHYLGYPSFVTKKLNDLSGFASFESVILDGIECTDEERNIILAMCREGIYL